MPQPNSPALTHLTENPGVYCMLAEDGTILYVGKARNLKKRVSQYFHKQHKDAKTQALVSQVARVDITLTQTETEALLLESNLIKHHHPKYNILLRDDKSYPYLLIDTTHPFPSLRLYRGKHKPKTGLCFGPFPNTEAAHATLNLLQKYFKIRNCQNTTFAARSRPCLQYQIKRCTAPCVGYITKQDYQNSIQDVCDFLEGKSQQILHTLTHTLEEAVAHLEFELAAEIRDKMQQLRLTQQSQAISFGKSDVDVITLHPASPIAFVEHVQIREGNIIHHQAFSLSCPLTTEQLPATLFEAFLRQYYLDREMPAPAKLLTDCILPQPTQKNFETLLHCKIVTHPQGIQKNWLAFAKQNLQHYVNQKNLQQTQLDNRFVLLEKKLGLPPVQRMECFDISHTKGNETIGACVVMTRDGPERAAYRRYTISGVTKGDDYAAIQFTLKKHYKDHRSLPDLILIDGGKGQVHAAQIALAHFSSLPPLLGITKGEGRKAMLDRIFDARTQQFLDFKPEDEALHLLQYIRDEAHRAAIGSHRKKRQQALFASPLNEIEGIGPKRKKALLLYFGGLQGIQKASVEELQKVQGISPTLAERIHLIFAKD